MNNFRVLAASWLVLLAACSDAPTNSRLGASDGPARNGGLGFGSGNVVPTDTAAGTMDTTPTGTATEPTEGLPERGGLGYGSGN